MEDALRIRANRRSIIAYILLGLTVFTIFLGLYLIREQLQNLALQEHESTKKDDINSFLYQVVIRLSFMILIFFVCQVLLRLYRYNILKADHYLACSDAIGLAKSLTAEQKQNFESILATISADKVALITPKSPTINFFGKKAEAADGTTVYPPILPPCANHEYPC